MRCSTNPHPLYCGLDLPARSMDVCIVSQEGDILLHHHMTAAPEPFLKALAPYRAGLVVAVEGIFPWYGLADLCADQGMPFVLGHALSMNALAVAQPQTTRLTRTRLPPCCAVACSRKPMSLRLPGAPPATCSDAACS